MNFAQYIYKNAVWNVNKNCFAALSSETTTEKQLFVQLRKLADRSYPFMSGINTVNTEFSLNRIALLRAKTPLQRQVCQMSEIYRQRYERIANLFDKKHMLFPSDGTQTRLEQIAELVAKCTQFAINRQQTDDIRHRITEIFDLTEREKNHLANAVALYKINYFCMAAYKAFQHAENAEEKLSRLVDSFDVINAPCEKTDCYAETVYATSEITAVVNCFGNSAVKLGETATAMDTELRLYGNGRNLFDTFCNKKFGRRTANFQSETKSLRIEMQYFLKGNEEIRRYRVTNKGKATRNITTEIKFANTATHRCAMQFETGNALCLGISDSKTDFYAALAVVADGKTIAPERTATGALFRNKIEAGDTLEFAAVTIFAENMPTVALCVEQLDCYGGALCPFTRDEVAAPVVRQGGAPLSPTPANGLLKMPAEQLAQTLDFRYQFGNNDVATFADGNGKTATLLDGFVFGLQGESFFAVNRGNAVKLNCGNFSLSADGFNYVNSNGKLQSKTMVCHEKGKTVRVFLSEKCRVLAYFPLEQQSKITPCGNGFAIESKTRSFTIRCFGKIESYTANALECNAERLRYRLTNNLQSGTCLAVCLAPCTQAAFAILSDKTTPADSPVVKDSLLSTYLNYYNDKNIFCFANNLKKPDALSMAAICYTNPQFVADYIKKADGSFAYYNASGTLKRHEDDMLVPLAALYYVTLTNDKAFLTEEMVNAINRAAYGDSKQTCLRALLLKKMAQCDCFDKVRALVEYNKLRKKVCNDTAFCGYAQAIGAAPIFNPSKQRLKDLCNQHNIPKSWYYVSQLENLYGVNIHGGLLTVRPRISAENTLEQLAITVDGKRIDATFTKGATQSVSLNGVACFQGLNLDALKNAENTLVVRY